MKEVFGTDRETSSKKEVNERQGNWWDRSHQYVCVQGGLYVYSVRWCSGNFKKEIFENSKTS